MIHEKLNVRAKALQDDALAKMKVIHVAGTKGKGSTCAFIESLLRAHGKRTGFPRKVGLYTSPHLSSVTERIRINFEPLSEEVFAEYFFQVYDAVILNNADEGPGYLQLLALISIHTFIREEVDVAIYETHHGGQYCATNVIEEPVVTAITTIGLDHINDLGPSVQNIAWHKAGILKAGATALTVPQEDPILTVLQHRAEEREVALGIVQSDHKLPNAFDDPIQRLNCSLGRAAADAFLQQTESESRPALLSEQDIFDGIKQFRWPGRFQIVRDKNYTWFLDVAHNEMSIIYASQWFQRVSLERYGLFLDFYISLANKYIRGVPSSMRVVIFSHMCNQKRDYLGIVKALAQSLQVSLDCMIFTTDHHAEGDYLVVALQIEALANHTSADLSSGDDETLSRYSTIWQDVRFGKESIYKVGTIGLAIELARNMARDECDVHILVTGSLFLVGGALQLVSRHPESFQTSHQ